MATALAESPDKPFSRAIGFFFGNTELSMELWTTIAGISGFDDSGEAHGPHPKASTCFTLTVTANSLTSNT